MIMELPTNFKISFAEVKNGTLLIYHLTRYEDLMYELTYALKKRKCVYCGRTLNRKNSTLDHRYPRDTGGVSITNNLFPCCQDENSNKGNLTNEEFLRLGRIINKKERKKYLKTIAKHNVKVLKEKGFKLPDEWVTYDDIENIQYRKPPEDLKGKKYYRTLEFYNKYKKLPRPVVVDKNNKLLDGYNIIVFAEDFEIQRIPIIKLENVELLN